MIWMMFYLNPVLIAAAVIPALFLLVKVYRADKLEKESPQILGSLVIYGVVATVFAMITERLGSWILSWFRMSDALYNVLLYFIVVAISEEGFKYLLLKRRTWRSPEFNCQFDGVVYAVFVSLGFALWENIGYVLRYGFGTAVVRAVTAVPGHACFGVFMGVFYGIAKKYERMGCESESKTFRVLTVVIPVLLHGTYDYIATIETRGYSWIFVVFVLALFAAAFWLIRKMSREDQYI
mgnify:CR=1 FL=1